LAKEHGSIDGVSSSLEALAAALSESSDLRALIGNPVVTRNDAGKTVGALAAAMKLDSLTSKTLGVLAANRRLDQLPALLRAFATLASDHRGEVTANVTSAHSLDDAQISKIVEQLKAKIGKNVSISTHVDPSILGGLVVRIGSQMIDSSIKTRLNTLSLAMKG
jgi:F-type H+-transporting ATPase subunit delta